jgi:peptide/nickel transport system substrate-binding protein
MSGRYLRHAATVGLLLMVMSDGAAHAQKPGGVLRIYHRDSPASMSIHEEGTNSVAIPMMAVFNNLVLYDQHKAQNSLDTIVPDLAESWSWNEEGTRLTFKLQEGVKWHDGKPFTSGDVKCTWDLLTGLATERLPSTHANRGGTTSRKSPPTTPPSSPSCSSGRSPRSSR